MWHPALPPAKPAPATHRGATCARLLGRGGTAPCRCPAGWAPRPPLPPTRGRSARGRPSAAACCRWKCLSLECAATPGEAAAAPAAAPAAVSAAGAQRPLAAARAVAVERSSARPGGRCRQRHRWCWRAGVAGQGGRSAVGPERRGVGVAAAGWVPAGVRGAHRPALVAGSVVLVAGCWRGQAPSGPWENSYEGPRPLFRSAGTGTHQQRQNAAENSSRRRLALGRIPPSSVGRAEPARSGTTRSGCPLRRCVRFPRLRQLRHRVAYRGTRSSRISNAIYTGRMGGHAWAILETCLCHMQPT